MRYLSSCSAESAVLVSSSNNNNNNNNNPHNHNNHNHKEKEKKKKKKKNNSSSSSSSNHKASTTSTTSKNSIQQFTYRDLEAATDGFSDQKLLGRGSHGLVYKAVLRGGRQVAVKKPNHIHHQTPNEVDNEIEILSNLHNPRLVNLLGFTTDPTPHKQLLVVEFMANGTLYQVLHSPPHSPPNWGRRIRLALQTAQAIHTLHSSTPPVIHRDIKSANVLIDRNFNARLGDFGLALRCHTDGYHLSSTPPAGTMGYLDPCYVTPDNLSTKTDVFSFGILLLEIISGRKAIDVNYSPPSIVDWAIPLIRRGKLLGLYDPRIEPPKDPSVRKQLAVIAAKCVRSCKERRPSMKDVVECLAGLTKLVPLHSWNGFTNPCLMVETIGRPVESSNLTRTITNNKNNNNKSAKEEEHVDNSDGSKLASTGTALRSSTKVYSDLSFKNNLMDFVIGADDKRTEFQGEHKKSAFRRAHSHSRFTTTESVRPEGTDNTIVCSKER